MGKMVFDLLCLLNVDEVEAKSTKPVQIFVLMHLFVLYLFRLQTHIAANTSNMRSSPHIVVHLVERFRVGSQSHVKKNRIFWLQLVANTIKEPVVGGKLSTILVFDAEQ